MDILDSINEIIVDEDTDSEVERDLDSIIVEVVEAGTMTLGEAQDITEAIRSTAMATYVLLAQAHEGKAYKALGYDTWADYVRQEFEFSPQRSYQLLDLSKVIKEIEGVTPEGTEVKLTEAQARDIKRELPKITEQIAVVTAELDPEDASEAVDRIVEEAREQQKIEQKVVEDKEKKLEEAELDGYHRGLEEAADALLDADRPDSLTTDADGEFLEIEVEGSGEGGVSPKDAMNLYNFVNALTGIDGLPEPDEFVKAIPDDRFDDMYDQVIDAAAWLNRLSTIMEMERDDRELSS